MRALAAQALVEIARAITRPRYLLRIDWTTTLYLSTRGTVVYDGQTWTGGTLTLERLAALPGAGLEGEISLTAADGTGAALALGGEISDVSFVLSMLYGDGPWAAGEAVVLAEGVLDGAEITATRVRFGLAAEGRRRAAGPRVYCSPPLMRHLPAPGSVLTWAGERYELVGAS